MDSENKDIGFLFQPEGAYPIGIRTIVPPRKIAPRLRLGFGSRLGLVLGLGATKLLSPRKIGTWLGLGFGLWLVLGLGEGNCPRAYPIIKILPR